MSGWPWPLDAVQGWFDGLWNWIFQVNKGTEVSSSEWIGGFTGWLGTLIREGGRWILDGVTAFLKEATVFVKEIRLALQNDVLPALSSLGSEVLALGQSVTTAVMAGLEGVVAQLNGAADTLGKGIAGLVDQAGKTLQGVGSWLIQTIWGWVDGALRWASDSFLWLQKEVADTGAYVVGQVATAFESSFSVVGSTISGIFGPVMGDVSNFLKAFSGISTAIDTKALSTQMGAAVDELSLSPNPPQEVGKMEAIDTYLKSVDKWARNIDSQVRVYIEVGQIIEAASLGQMDITYLQYLMAPKFKAFSAAASQIWSLEFEARMGIPAQQHFMAKYTPLLPQVQDLIRFVVREVITPETFKHLMPYLGFSEGIAEWFWEAHWVLPSTGNLYDAFHRGVINSEELDKFVVWHDFSPEPRPGVGKSDVEIMRGILKTLIPRVDLRFAWEMGQLSDEELVERYVSLGYEDDAPLMAAIQKARALVEEVHKVRDEWLREFQEGFIVEDILRANLAAIGIGPARIEYYISYATLRREREAKKDTLDLYRDGFMKDMIDEGELRNRVLEIIAVPEVADLFVEKAYVDKFKRPLPPRETDEEKALKELRKYQITYAIQAYRKYAVEKAELITLLVGAGVDPAVAGVRANYEELKRPKPKPTPLQVSTAKEDARIQTLEVQGALAEYRRYVIDDDELLKRLIATGLSEALATAQMQLESIRRGPPPISPLEVERRRVSAEVQRLTGLALVAQYRRYAIEKVNVIQGLTDAGFDPAEAAARADYEEARRPIPKPSATERAALKEEALIRGVQERIVKLEYRRYLIDSEELRRRLLDLEYTADAAEAIATLESLTRPGPEPSEEERILSREATQATRLNEASAVNGYVKGLISEAELRDKLEGLGYGRDLVDALVSRANVRTFRPPAPPPAPVVREAPVGTLLRAFRLDLITAPALLSELVRRDYSTESATLMLNVEAAKKA